MNLHPAPGIVLAAAHTLTDPNFKRSVIFLAQHESSGTLGYVINRPLQQTLIDILPDETRGFDAPLYWGGPCQNDTLHCVHRIGTVIPGALEIADGIFWGGQFDALMEMFVSGGATNEDIRFFVGYAGWSEEQLAGEIAEKSWILTESSTKLLFDEAHKNLWSRVVASLGGEYHIIAGTPEHPSLN